MYYRSEYYIDSMTHYLQTYSIKSQICAPTKPGQHNNKGKISALSVISCESYIHVLKAKECDSLDFFSIHVG